MLGKAVAEFSASAEEAGLSGGFGDVEFEGDFGEGQAHGLAEEERFAKQVGDAIDLGIEDSGHFVASKTFFGVFSFIAKFEAGLVFVRAGIIKVGEISATELAEAHQTLVDDDAGEPGGEAGVAFKAAEVKKCFGVGILDLVFGVFVVAENGAGEFDTGLIVPVDEIGESGLVALLGAADEIGVGVDDGLGFRGGIDCYGDGGKLRDWPESWDERV